MLSTLCLIDSDNLSLFNQFLHMYYVFQPSLSSNTLTVDENAFFDAMSCMYFLNKNEIAHTTNISGLRKLCVLLGNEHNSAEEIW